MIDLKDITQVKVLQSNLRTVFSSPQGIEVMKFIESIGSWTPSVFDTIETNEVIARDANRRLIGTLKTLIELNPEEIVLLANKE